MRILLLGGTGTMGKPLSTILAKDRNNMVSVLCRKKPNQLITGVDYILGSFSDQRVRALIQKDRYDVIVDFLWHNDKKYSDTFRFLSELTDHYVYVSSAAVYANSDIDIREDAHRYIDDNYSEKAEYHLQKARMENVIFQSNKKNWTIVRPHVTFNSNHIPLSIWGETVWAFRYIQGHSIVFTKQMLEKKTNYTYGGVVANQIASIIYSPESTCQIYNVAAQESYTWELIISIIKQYFIDRELWPINIKVISDESNEIVKLLPNLADRLIYDRLLNRIVDTSKVRGIQSELYHYELKDQLYDCLDEFFSGIQKINNVQYNDATSIAYLDWITKEKTPIKFFPKEQRLKYLFLRFFVSYRISVRIYYGLKNLKKKIIP